MNTHETQPEVCDICGSDAPRYYTYAGRDGRLELTAVRCEKHHYTLVGSTVLLTASVAPQLTRTNTYPLAFYDDLCEAAGEETVLDAYATEGEAGIEQLASIHKVLCREE